METTELKNLIAVLITQNTECEWIEFKQNYHSPEEIGQDISALANSACILKKPYGYIIFGIDDTTRTISGTNFKAKSHKAKGNEELELWLCNRLNPRIDFESYELDYAEGIHISLYKIPSATNVPITFLNEAYIRVGSNTKRLKDYNDKQAKIWRNVKQSPFETIVAKEGLSASDIIRLLSTETYFDLMKIPYPQTTQGVISRLISESIIKQNESYFDITELGAILFAKDLSVFGNLSRKAIRVIVYKGKNKVETIRDQIGTKGYALGFTGLIEWINGQLPANEEIGKALRKEVRMYPDIAIRELVANCIIHQDFSQSGFPSIEIYSDRIEISNPGTPLISTERFIDEYVSRNDKLADLMRRMGFCEEKGSGLDKVIFHNELYQLPAINIQVQNSRTIVKMYAYKSLNDTDKNEKIMACYQHACLKYVSNEKMTNQSLRDRFGIEEQNAATASRIIKDTLEAGRIKEDDPDSNSRKFKKYIPIWA